MNAHRRRFQSCLLVGIALAFMSACSPSAFVPVDRSGPIKLSANIADRATQVAVSKVVVVKALSGRLDKVVLKPSGDGRRIKGAIESGTWRASERLEPATTYQLKVLGTGDNEEPGSLSATFSTRSLTLDQQTYPSVAPLQGETVGVGMPVIVRFDLPVKNRRLYEEHMKIDSTPRVDGAWNWLSDREVHFRPKEFWPAGTKVRVRLQLNSLPAGRGIFGQQDQNIDFTIGRKVVSTVDIDKHQMKIAINGRVVRQIPVTTGDSTHQTRIGTKIIMEKFSSIDMDAATTGVDSTEPGYYNIKDVRWAMRLTNSGEFVHAAPWSVASQGIANVSHGCTGLSTADAAWLYEQSRRGDVMRFVDGTRPMENQNGWTDWNVSWSEWIRGSALKH